MAVRRKVELLESFKTGHPEIDADHRVIVDIINDISDAIRGGDIELCRNLLDSFLDVVRDHFEREERILEDIEFPGLAKHRGYHGELVAKAMATKRRCEEMSDSEKLDECFHDLAGFLIDDIVKGDLGFKSFLIEKGLARR